MKLELDGIYLTTDDAEVKAILAYHSQLAALTPRLPGSHRVHCAWSDAQHYYCAAHYTGYENDTDNGYVLLRVAHDVMPVEQVAQLFREFINTGRDFSRAGLETFETVNDCNN